MKHVKIQNGTGGWELGGKIALHLLEIDPEGVVKRMIDLDHAGNVIDAAPTDSNPYGAIDHPPLSPASDWSDVQISKQEFESMWAKVQTA